MTLQLRPLEPEDLDWLYSIENDTALWDTSNTDIPYSRYALRQYIAEQSSFHECGNLRLAITLNHDADFSKAKNTCEPSPAIGLVDITDFSPLHAHAEVGITLFKQYRGCGYGTEALRQICQIAKNRLHLHTLIAHVSISNESSLRLFQCAGFQHIGTLKEWHCIDGIFVDAYLFQKIL